MNSANINQQNLRQQETAHRQLSICNIYMQVCGSKIGFLAIQENS